jgi:hypothetical protein
MSARVFVSCHNTAAAEKILKGLAEEKDGSDVRTSNPPFNKWKGGKNVPVYGYEIMFTARKLALLKKVAAFHGKEYACGVDKFVQGKACELGLIAEACDSIGAEAAAKQLRQLDLALSELDPSTIKSREDWEAFLRALGVPDDWPKRLHFEKVLGLFGLTEAQQATLLEMRVAKTEEAGVKRSRLVGEEYGGPGEIKTLRNNNVTWLSKNLALFRVSGCLTDIVNLAFVMLDDGEKKNGGVLPTEEETVDKLETLIRLIEEERWEAIPWIPDVHLHDAEGDDQGANGIIACIRAGAGLPPCREIVQLPPEEVEIDLGRGKTVKASFAKLAQKYRLAGAEVFHDPDSRNAKPVYFAM